MTTVPVDHHQRSLEALAAANGDFSLRAALDWVFPITTPSLGRVELAKVRLHEQSWWEATATQPRWVRPALFTLVSSDQTVDIDVSLPWLCDDRALSTTYGDRDLQLGAHRGLFLGRPLQPRAQLVPRPGLHRRHVGGRTLLTLVADLGPSVSFGIRRGGLCVRFGKRPEVMIPPMVIAGATDGRPIDAIEATADGEVDRGTLRRLVALATDGGALTRRFCPETLAQVDATLGITDATWAERFALLTNEHRIGEFIGADHRLADELSDEALQIRLYGDIVRRTVAEGILRGTRRFREAEPALAEAAKRRAVDSSTRPINLLAQLARRLEDQTQSTVDQVLRPGTLGGIVGPDDDRGTVASVEARRIVTRYGPGGVGRLGPHQLWLRGIHADRRGQLCPLLTPESEDIGLLRSFALGADVRPGGVLPTDSGDPFGDLSVAAGLIPFINHDDPTRASIAARMLRQTVPIAGAERPRVETSVADLVAEAHGVARTPISGRVVDSGSGWLSVKPERGDQVVIGFGPAMPSPSAVNGAWRLMVATGDRVYQGDAVAHAPDVVLDASGAHLAQGRDCLVAYTPWHGWNYEDAIVVSEAVIENFASEHLLRFVEPLDLHGVEVPGLAVSVGQNVVAGAALVEIGRGEQVRRVVRAATDGVLTRLEVVGDEVMVELRVRRPLAVGDKLTNRHGAKGVVSAVLPVEAMPQLPDGRPVEVLLNPVGVIRRLNLSQLFETHTTLLEHLTGREGTEVVGRTVAPQGNLRAALEAAGAPGGRLRLTVDGTELGDDRGVVVGWQHLLKLDHVAANKLRARGAGRQSPLTQQPAKGATWVAGRLVGGAQRLGEMELWALQAAGADHVVSDALARSDDAHRSLRAVATHLRAAGLGVETDPEGRVAVTFQADLRGLQPLPEDIVQAIVDPNVYGLSTSPSRDPLHNHHHGLDEDAVVCWCGVTEGTGTVCSQCGSRATRHPGAIRSTCCFVIQLAVPVRHPWFDDGQMVLESLPLLPPAYRPFEDNRIDIAYRILITTNERLRGSGDTSAAAERQLHAAVERVLGRVDETAEIETIASRLNGKRGLLRRSLRGRDTDFAARGVMVPDPTIGLEEIGIPTSVMADLGINDGDDELGDVVLVNRQPSLLPTNLVAVQARGVPGSAFRVHPFLCARLAGDFDGDELTVHRPASDAARADAWARLRPASSFRHPATGRPVAKVDLDVALGLCLLGRTVTERRSLVARLGLPDNDPIAEGSGPITPRDVSELVARCAPIGVGGAAALDRFAELFRSGVDAATGWSFSAVELEPMLTTALAGGGLDEEVVARATWGTALGDALTAGVAGKLKGIVQLLASRGSLEGFDGEATATVEASFLSGLDDQGFFDTAPGGLRALSDKKLVTPLAGGVTKALIEAAYDVTIGANDCGSQHESFGAVLTCLLPDASICARCYAASGGDGVDVGDRVGLQAAFAIGEGSTQKAMKAFQGGTTVGIGSRVARVRGLFGRGATRFDIAGRPVQGSSLQRRLADRPSTSDRLDLFAELDAQANDALEGDVPSHHFEVLWRRLVSVHDAGGTGALLDRAQRTGSPLLDGTTRGRLELLFAAPDTTQTPVHSELRMRLVGQVLDDELVDR